MRGLAARFSRGWLTAGIGCLLTVAAGWVARFYGFGERVHFGDTLERLSYDLPFMVRPRLDPETAVIVYMDEFSERAINQEYGEGTAWSRPLHARLLDLLKSAGARLVVMDIVFDLPGSEAETRPLAEAMERFGGVIVGAELLPGGEAGHWSFFGPNEAIEAAVAGVGLVHYDEDSDYGIRRHFRGYAEPGLAAFGVTNSLSWVAANEFLGDQGPPVGGAAALRWLNYYGPPSGRAGPATTIPSFGYYQVLEGLEDSGTSGVDPEWFRDKVVFVGQPAKAIGSVGAGKDAWRNPYTWLTHEFSSGIEVHATTFLNLVDGTWLRRIGPWGEFGILTLFGLAAGYGICRFRPGPATLVGLASGGVVVLGAYLLFRYQQVWFAWAVLVGVQLPIAYGWSVLVNSFQLYGEKKSLEQSLSLHLSAGRVKQIQKHPELLKPGAEKRRISILFSDIENFSPISGRMDSEDLFKMLNRYFETTLGCIHRADGTVIKLIGDAIFAVWNAPFEQRDFELNACRAALDLHSRLIEFDLESRSLPLRTRVGVHTGTAHVGNVGSSTRFDYTAIGDSINLTSRIEGLNKHLGTNILTTRETLKAVGDAVVSRLVGYFKLKGIDRVVEVHELVSLAEEREATESWRKAFGEALFHFQRREFDEAAVSFERVLDGKTGDGPSRFYLERVQRLKDQPPAKDWAGEVEITEK